MNAQLGLEYKWLEANLSIRYNSDMRTTPGQGRIAKAHLIPSHMILDASLKARVNRYLTLTLNAVNLTNKVYLVSRHPSGLRPGHPLGIYGGVRIHL